MQRFVFLVLVVLITSCSKENYVHVSSVSLDKTSIILIKGYETTIKQIITPANASNHDVVWISTNTAVVAVSDNGILSGIETGTADIVVTTACGSKTASCTVTVIDPSAFVCNEDGHGSTTSITLNLSELSLKIGENATLYAFVGNENDGVAPLSWVSINPEVATVNDNGEVIAISAGATVVIVSTEDGSKSAFCSVAVSDKPMIPVTGVSLGCSVLIISAGETASLAVTVEPIDATCKTMNWTIMNTDVATVNEEGAITGVSNGTTTIIATTKCGGKIALCNIIVAPKITFTGASINNKYLIFALAGYGEVSIDWGNGSAIEKRNLLAYSINWPTNNENERFKNNSFTKGKITIFGGTITHFACAATILDSDLDVRYCPTLTFLNCINSQLTTLDLSKNTALTTLECSSNPLLTRLDISNNVELEDIVCLGVGVSSLDVSKNTKLKRLWTKFVNISTLDLSNNTKLVDLNCSKCNLSILDISKNTELESIECNNNLLTKLDISNNKKLTFLDCGYNEIPKDELLQIFHSLPASTAKKIIIVSFNPGSFEIDTDDRKIALDKGWQFGYY